MNNSINNDVNIKNDQNNIENINVQSNIDTNNNIVKYEISDTNLLIAYIKKNQEKILKGKFSIPAFLFNGYYLLYRKMYGLGFIVCFIITLLLTAYNYFNNNIIIYITIFITFIISILLGIFINKYYLEKSYKEIMKIKKINKSEEELIKICHKKGGTSFIKMILMIILISILVSAINMSVFKVIKDNLNKNDINNNIENTNNINIEYNTSKKYDGSLMYDTSINILDKLSITIPNNFKEGFMNDNSGLEYEYNDGINDCKFSLNSVLQYTNSNKLIKEMAEYYKVNDVKVDTINNIQWDNFIYQNSFGTNYVLTTTKDNKVYVFEYRVVSEDNNKICTNYYNNILKTINLK